MLEGKANMENEANNKNKKYDESRVYYVYKHVRLDNNTCFYIGKGKNGRKDIPNRNPTHDSICKEHGYKVVIFKDKLNEAEAITRWNLPIRENSISAYQLNNGIIYSDEIFIGFPMSHIPSCLHL